jgi:quercetin dioxygenase-like cupin family protein
MQRALAIDSRRIAGGRTINLVVAALLFSLMLFIAPSAAAQDSTPAAPSAPSATPGATPAAGATPQATTNELGDVLMTYDFDALPPAPMTVRMLRITLAPGASVPMHTHPGIEFDLVESGTLTADTNDTAVINVDGEQSETSESQDLSAGNWIMYPAGSGMSFTNQGEEDVVLLSAVVLSVADAEQSTITYTEGEPTEADFEGVSFVVLGDGLIQQFPDGPATVTIDRLTLAAGAPVPGFTGVAMLSKAAGTMAFSADQGQVQVTRTATPQLQPNAIPGQEFTLNDNDAAFFPVGYDTIQRTDSTSELTLLRLLIEPEGDLEGATATVTTIPVEETATTDQPTVDSNGLGIGAVIALNADGVRLRADASTSSDIVDSFPAGTQFEIIDGPVEGESYTWYQVRGVGDLESVEGWLVTDFMDVIEPASGTAQPSDGSAGTDEAAATPSAEATAEATTSGEFAAGDTVVTTEENVRIRTEPSVNGEILTAVPAGTQLEIISGPEEAEDYTWYEVQVVGGDTSGWTAVDFLQASEPAE